MKSQMSGALGAVLALSLLLPAVRAAGAPLDLDAAVRALSARSATPVVAETAITAPTAAVRYAGWCRDPRSAPRVGCGV